MDKLVAKINKLILRISKGDEDALNELSSLFVYCNRDYK